MLEKQEMPVSPDSPLLRFGRNPRLLVVDDNCTNIDLIKKQLHGQSYHFEDANNGYEALEKIRNWKPDLVLLDLMMPGMSGYEVCKTVKSDKDLRFIPVIVITALSELEDKLKAIDMGADDFLIKPFNKLELATRIRSLLRLKALYDDLDTSENILFSLARALEAKDRYTRGHSERVARYSRLLAKGIGLPEHEQEHIWRGGLLHDIGKIGIAEAVLHKAGPLTPEEMDHIRTHPQKGFEICSPLKSLTPSLSVIKNHHERFDGCGHPDKLECDKIPLMARISSIADSFDAMTTDRPYRKGMKFGEAVAIFERERESGQWDPVLVTEFVTLIKKGFEI
ncbi:MAG TPA: HD domain-containing phosphohydrolase [bacterium]|nr:HD domain-containing phosphohydrolase [bacterium]